MNSIILIAACAVCLDQLFFRGRLASYVVDNLKGPKKRTKEDDERFSESFEKLIQKALAAS